MTLTTSTAGAGSPSAEDRPLVEDILDEFTFWTVQGRRAMARHWCQQDLSLSHVHALALLQAEGPLPMSRLAEQMSVSLPNATGIIGRMEERGLVERTHDQLDRRVVTVRATARGLAAMEEAEDLRRRRLRLILARLDREQQERCLRSLQELRAAAEQVDPVTG